MLRLCLAHELGWEDEYRERLVNVKIFVTDRIVPSRRVTPGEGTHLHNRIMPVCQDCYGTCSAQPDINTYRIRY